MARLSTIAWLLGAAIATGAAAQQADPPAADSPAAAAEQDAAPEEATASEDNAPRPADLTQPPRIGEEPAPGDTRLEPAEDERDDLLEAVVTGGQTDFRLPDLGTSLRNEEEVRDPNQRMEVSFLNLYDPENRDPAEEAFPSLEEQLGVGMLRVFRIRFGNRDD